MGLGARDWGLGWFAASRKGCDPFGVVGILLSSAIEM